MAESVQVFCQSAIDSAQNDHVTMMHAILAKPGLQISQLHRGSYGHGFVAFPIPDEQLPAFPTIARGMRVEQKVHERDFLCLGLRVCNEFVSATVVFLN